MQLRSPSQLAAAAGADDRAAAETSTPVTITRFVPVQAGLHVTNVIMRWVARCPG